MPLFGKRDQYSDAPKFIVDSTTSETGQDQFGNTVFGVDAAEVGVTHAAGHSGWVKVTEGSGNRAGRIQYEVLVAGSITGDATDFANTSTSDVANTSGTADDATFADT